MDFELSDILGPVGVLLRARLYDPADATVTDLALTEGADGVYGGTVTLSPTPDDDPDAYTYEVREVSAQTSGAFTASTSVIIAPDVYGYVTNGEWSEFSGGAAPDVDAYITVSDLNLELGEDNADIHSDLNNDDTAETAQKEHAIAQGTARVNRKLGLASPPPTTFPVTSTTAWVTADIAIAATKYAAGILLNKRGRQGMSGATGTDLTPGDRLIADGDEILADLITAGLPGVTVDAEDATPPAGTFAFIAINRGTDCDDDEYAGCD